MTLSTHPNAKINLGLHVLSRRQDGYHNIESIFVPITDLCDDLHITPLDDKEGEATFESSDKALQNDDNLCMRAYRLMRDEFPDKVRPVHIRLDKHIPYGAGLGGGSADAAFTLTMLNELFAIGLNSHHLSALAARLGADCPFFVLNHAAYVTGIGDFIMPIPFSLSQLGLRAEIRKPEGVCISTKQAYAGITPRNLTPAKHTPNLLDVVQRPVEEWRQLLVNDFEDSIFPQAPAIEELKEQLYDEGAVYASMTGSGSACFGLFRV